MLDTAPVLIFVTNALLGRSLTPEICTSKLASTPKTAAPKPGTKEAKFDTIKEQYESIEEVQEGVQQAGLESSQLIVGIDFTRSTDWTGQHTIDARCLHDFSSGSSPYVEVLSIVAKPLSAVDDDNLIPCPGLVA